MDKVNRKNSRAVLMLNKYQNINTEVMYSIPEVQQRVYWRYKIKVHCGFGGWVERCIHFVHLAKMEFKLKLCFQNDLIRFIGDKLDKHFD
jgi:hypothetical protein